ncbi:MAG: CvpA family protein [Clostridiales bacterium]|jgi:uncharacterized membrane protein required for colicin V production|nr:CvpA family protein [Clostridiales bacterium]
MLLDIIIVLFLCLGLVIGWQQGLYRFIRRVLPLVGSLLVAFFVCRFLAQWLFDSQNSFFTGFVGDWFKGDLFESPVIVEDGKLFIFNGTANLPMKEALEGALGVFSGTVDAIVTKLVAWNVIHFEDGASMASVFVPAVALMICYAASFIAIFIVSLIIISLLNKLIAKLVKKPVIKHLDKVLGAVLWAVLIFGVLYGLLGLLMLFETEAAVQPFMEYLSQSTVAQIMYENNIFVILIKKIAESFSL